MFGFRVLGFGAFTVADTTFSVANSARFNDGDSDHLLNTPRSAISERIGTISFWVKRGVLGTTQAIFSNERNDANSTAGVIEFQSDDQLRWKAENTSGSNIMVRETTQVFRDPHAWYHILCNWNSNKTDDSGANVYVNGNQVSSFATKTNFASAQDLGWPSSAKEFEIGRQYNGANYLDGYLAQFAFVDGIQLTPTTFGQFNTSGVWTPINVTTQAALQVGSTAEAIVNSASAVVTTDATSYTFSSVAFGTASATRAIYAFISGQHSTGNTPTFANVTIGGVGATLVTLVNNTTEPHYAAALFRADVPSGTSGDIVVGTTTAAENMSQLGVIAWAVTGDHYEHTIKSDTDTSSATTTTVSLTNVPAGSVILAGRASATGGAHTWSSNLTENIDQIVEETGATDVRHTGASTATANGGDFTITCAPDSGADGRGRMVAIVLSPNQGFGSAGAFLPFTSTVNIGQDESQDFDTTTTSANFDGSNDYLTRGGAMTGMSDGTACTFSCFVRKTGGDGSAQRIFIDDQGHINFGLGSSNKVEIALHTSGASELSDVHSSNTITADGVWHHIMFSSNTSTDAHNLYIDGVDVQDKQNSTTGTVDFTRTDYAVGAATNGGSKFNGEIAELYFTTEFVDLSTATNRLKFLAADGKPANLGADGSTPTGTQPLLYLANPFGTFQNNLGSGGNFTENGELTEGRTVRSAFANDFTPS